MNDSPVFAMDCPLCQTPNLDSAAVCSACASALVATPVLHLSPGALLHGGRYRIDSLLGQGGFAMTYVATDLSLNRRVAIKELFPDGCLRAGDSVHPSRLGVSTFIELKNRFLEEAQILAGFTHPSIVRVFEVWEEHATAYIAMEYIQGKTLGQVLDASAGPLDPKVAVSYISQVAMALAQVHDAQLLHRDIKPDNIILTDDSKVVLIDFGTARHFESTGKSLTYTTLLTPGYAPLEQYSDDPRARRKIGPATDIYALGATLYHLVTGSKPVYAPDRANLDLDPPDQLNPKVSSQVSEAIVWALEVKATDRPQTVKEFLGALSRGTGKGAGAPPPTPPVVIPPAPPVRPPVTPQPPNSGAGPTGGRWISDKKGLVAALIILIIGGVSLGPRLLSSSAGPIGNPRDPSPSPTEGSTNAATPEVLPTMASCDVGAIGCATQTPNTFDPQTQRPHTEAPATQLIAPNTQPPPNKPPATQPPAAQPPNPGQDGRTFVSESSPLDGATIGPGSTFNKRWTMKNSGTTTWSTGSYQAVQVDGSYGPASISLSSNTAPGSTVDISASFTAPVSAGTHRSTYRMTGPNGQFGANFWVEIVVKEATKAPASRNITVNSTEGWQSTGISLAKGEQFDISNLSGSWTVDHRNFSYVGPGGYSSDVDQTIQQGCKFNSSSTYGTLLGGVGNVGFSGINRNGTATSPANGTLSLRINDTCFGDNAGSVSLTITTYS